MGLDALGLNLNALPKIAGTCKGRALVCGSARCLWDDLEKVSNEADVICVNGAGMHFPRAFAHWYSDHFENAIHWRGIRKGMGYDGHPVFHSSSEGPLVDCIWPWPRNGSSSLGAVFTGLALGYEEITICGVPLDDSGHFYDAPEKTTNFTNEVPEKAGFPRYWQNAARDVFEGRVKAVSGRLVDLLGSY